MDRIRSSLLGEPIERYVAWMTERKFSARIVCRRVPILIRFGDFARDQGAFTVNDLPTHIDAFVSQWIAERAYQKSEHRRKTIVKEVRGPIEQLLDVVLTDFTAPGRRRHIVNPFAEQTPDFFDYLRDERGLRVTSIRQYAHHLRELAKYLGKIGLQELSHLSPPVLSGFAAGLWEVQFAGCLLCVACFSPLPPSTGDRAEGYEWFCRNAQQLSLGESSSIDYVGRSPLYARSSRSPEAYWQARLRDTVIARHLWSPSARDRCPDT